MTVTMPQKLSEGTEVVVIQTKPSTPMQLLTTGSAMQIRVGFGTVTKLDAETGEVTAEVDPAQRTHDDMATVALTWNGTAWEGGTDTIAPRDLELFAGKDLATINADMVERSNAALPQNVREMLAKMHKAKKS